MYTLANSFRKDVPTPYILLLMDVSNFLLPTPYHSYPVPQHSPSPHTHICIFLSLPDKGTVPSVILKSTPKCLYIFGRLFSMKAATATAFTILEPIMKNSQWRSNSTYFGFFREKFVCLFLPQLWYQNSISFQWSFKLSSREQYILAILPPPLLYYFNNVNSRSPAPFHNF